MLVTNVQYLLSVHATSGMIYLIKTKLPECLLLSNIRTRLVSMSGNGARSTVIWVGNGRHEEVGRLSCFCVKGFPRCSLQFRNGKS